ncbi:MAG: CapA family protein [Coprobacillaceae bacterium]
MRKRKLNMKKVGMILLIPIILIATRVGYLMLSSDEDSPKTTNNTDKVDASKENSVSFLAVGDNLGHERVYTYADSKEGEVGDGKYDFKPSYTKVADTIKNADLAFINQESIIGGDDLGITGYPAFNSHEQWASDLTDFGFDMVNGATNHSLDKGFKAVQNTAEIWRQYDDVIFAGAYDSQEDADTIRVIERDGIKFSLLSYTYGTNGYTAPNDYCVPLFDENKITEDVKKAKEVSDVVIVSAHWGTESDYTVTETQKSYAQLFADLGVDLVIGTHPHVIQPLEWVTGTDGNKTLVAYSLGNFLSTMETVDTQLEGMLSLDFVKSGDTISIENVVWTPLINHFGDGTFQVMPLKSYTDELNKVHYVLGDEEPNAIEAFKQKTKEVIGDDFKIDM